MQDNIIPVGETPIFQELAAEYIKRGKRIESVAEFAPSGWKFVPVPETAKLVDADPSDENTPLRMRNGARPIWLAMDEVAEFFEKTETPRVAHNVNPEELEEQGVSYDQFIQGVIRNFIDEYPNVSNAEMSTTIELDGSVTVVVEGAEAKEDHGLGYRDEAHKGFVECAMKDFKGAHPNAVITDVTPKDNEDGSVTMEIEAVESGVPPSETSYSRTEN